MRYPAAVQRYFDHPANVGPLAPGRGRVARGMAGTPAGGTRIVIEADVIDGRVARMSFQACGCPYTIAACSRATEAFTGAAVAALCGFDPGAMARELTVPPEKLGCLLLLQDALRNCFADWDTTQPAGPP